MFPTRRLLLVVVFIASLCTAFAQIPNGGFEAWAGGDYLNPVGWLTYNDVATVGGYTVEPGTPGFPGNSHAVITSRPASGGSGVVQGWVSVGMFGTNGGFPYAARPEMLTGQWQYGVQPNDTAQIQVALNNGGSGTLIAFGTLEVIGSLGTWQMFQVPLTYLTTETPDTAYIQIVSSISFASPVVGSFIKVDDLAFVGTVGMAEQDGQPFLSVFPSPANDLLNISSSEPGEFRLFDATGRLMLRSRVAGQVNTLDVSSFAPGLFTYQLVGQGGRPIATGRWVKE